MANKTIIDGTDESKCKYKIQSSENFKTKPYCSILNKLCEDISFVCDKNCQIFEDLKQLARAKEENEELRQKHNSCCEEFKQEINLRIDAYNKLSRDFYSGKYCNTKHCQQLQIKEQECEELKKEIAFGNNGQLSDKIRATVFKDLNEENLKYKQVLNEIKKNCTDNYYVADPENRWIMDDIMNIINKAREE